MKKVILTGKMVIKALMVAVLILQTNFTFGYFQKDNNAKYYKTFQEVFEKIERDYVNEPDKQKLLDSALEGMLTSLDPHSTYFTDEDLEDFLNNTKGEFGGIGVEIIYDNGSVKVISPIDDLPAAKAGIAAGDYIVKVDGETVNNLGFNKAVKQMRGAPGTKVKITIVREGENKPLDFELSREIVKIKAIKHVIDNDIAYIRIVTFNENTTAELHKVLKSLESEKLKTKGIILDLRNNPGGLLEQSISISETFIDQGVIVSTKGRIENSVTSFNANKDALKAPKLPMIVLINGGSASASEIVAGALQDYKRAIIVGTKSFGKGSVQTLTSLNNRAAIKLTTAIYYTPSGKSIQADGITPDIIIEPAKVDYQAAENEKRFSETSLKNYLINEQLDNKSSETKATNKDHLESKDTHKDDKNKVDQSIKADKKNELSDLYKKDYQYSRAYDLLKSIIILDKNYEHKK